MTGSRLFHWPSAPISLLRIYAVRFSSIARLSRASAPISLLRIHAVRFSSLPLAVWAERLLLSLSSVFTLSGSHLFHWPSEQSVCFSAFTLSGSCLFHWQSEHSICSYLSLQFLSLFLLLLVYLCWCRSLPPLISSLGQPWSRISAAFCIQPVYATISACIYKHTVGTHTSAPYHFCCPCTVSVHTPTVLLGYLL